MGKFWTREVAGRRKGLVREKWFWNPGKAYGEASPGPGSKGLVTGYAMGAKGRGCCLTRSRRRAPCGGIKRGVPALPAGFCCKTLS